MEHKFKAGDKVRMKQDCPVSSYERCGEVVVLVDRGGNIETPKGCTCHTSAYWELVTPATKTDLNDLAEGDVLVTLDEEKNVVLGRAGKVFWYRSAKIAEFNCYISPMTIDSAEYQEWKFYTEEVKEEWPKKGDEYQFIGIDGDIDSSHWYDDGLDRKLKNYSGIFKSIEEAEARRDLIKKYVQSLN